MRQLIKDASGELQDVLVQIYTPKDNPGTYPLSMAACRAAKVTLTGDPSGE